jgi:hypothetical protein
MFDEIDAVINRSDCQMTDDDMYRRAVILDGFQRTPEQEQEIVGIIKPQINTFTVSSESLIGFITDKLVGLFGTHANGPAPDPLLLATKSKQFLRELEQTYGNVKWIENKQFVDSPITIGVLSREWMVGTVVAVTLTNYLEPILEAIEKDLDIHGQKIDNYLGSLRTLSEAIYKVDPATAVAMVEDHKRKRPAPETPKPIDVTFIGNYRIGRMHKWYTLDVHPKTPEPPKLVDPLNPQFLAIAGKDMVNLMSWLIRYEEKYNRYNFSLDDKATVYTDLDKRNWWLQAENALGKAKAEALWEMFNPFAVLPLVMGLIPAYRSIGYRYAKAMYARMQASIK